MSNLSEINKSTVEKNLKVFNKILSKHDLPLPQSTVYGSAINLSLSFPDKSQAVLSEAIAIASVWGWLADDYQDSQDIDLDMKIELFKSYLDIDIFNPSAGLGDVYLGGVLDDLMKLIRKSVTYLSDEEKGFLKEEFELFVHSMLKELISTDDLSTYKSYLKNGAYSVFMPFLGACVYLFSKKSKKTSVSNFVLIKEILEQMGLVCRITNDFATLERELKEGAANIFSDKIKDKGDNYQYKDALMIIYEETHLFFSKLLSLHDEDRFKQYLSSFFWAFQRMYLVSDIRVFTEGNSKDL